MRTSIFCAVFLMMLLPMRAWSDEDTVHSNEQDSVITISEENEVSVFGENDKPGVAARGLSLLVNLDDITHFDSVVKEAFKTIRAVNVPLDTVYGIGATQDPQKVVPLLLGISLWGGEFRHASTVPEQFAGNKITRSPTWVIRTDQGDVLVEGRLSIKSMFNKKGEFVAPGKVGEK